jgi:MoxR-like ATPase
MTDGYDTTFEPHSYRLGDDDETPRGRDIREGSVYVWPDEIVLVVRVAMATGRPLLLRGLPGSGKSSLAAFVARSMRWNYFEHVITSRTQAQDLQWTFDAVRRLRDAMSDRDLDEGAYVDPGVLWWAYDPRGARVRGFGGGLPNNIREATPPGELRGIDHPGVVLLDEIDKADPDVPNDLLVALGSLCFRVAETGLAVEAGRTPLIVITTNKERALTPAFLRRCVIHELKPHNPDRLVEIAKAHFPHHSDHVDLFRKIADRVDAFRKGAATDEVLAPSTAEYLDAVRACLDGGVVPGDSPHWQAIERGILQKPEWT